MTARTTEHRDGKACHEVELERDRAVERAERLAQAAREVRDSSDQTSALARLWAVLAEQEKGSE